MIHTEKTVRTLQAVAMSVGLSVLLWSTGLPTVFLRAEAASITSASDTLSNSTPAQTSNHTIAFSTDIGMAIGENFTVTFAAAFDTATVAIADIDLIVEGVDQTVQSGASGAGAWGVSGLGTDAITFTTPTNANVASSSDIIVKIGSNATVGGTGTMRIVNPSIGSYVIDIAGTMQDSGQIRVAIVDQVLVSASVEASLTFAVSGLANGQNVNGTTTTLTSTPTTIPFDTLVAGQIKTLAHELAVTTNAKNGYTVTVQQTGDLQSSTGAVIDGFSNGTNVTIPGSWSAPSAQIADIKSYGHWGITSDDLLTEARTNEFTSNSWVSGSTTPVVVMGHDGPSDGNTSGQGKSRVGYQIEISALQEAGDDYTTSLRYVATPTF